MKTTNVAIVNGISLQVVSSENEQLVAIKPVCEILGVSLQGQLEKLKSHPVFSSVIKMVFTTGADGKSYEMACLPLRYLPGWVFSIHPEKVKEDVYETIIEYQKKCIDVLYDYFFSRVDFSRKKEVAVTKAKEACDEKAEQLRIAESELKVAENELSKALALTFEDWQADRQQLTIPGF